MDVLVRSDMGSCKRAAPGVNEMKLSFIGGSTGLGGTSTIEESGSMVGGSVRLDILDASDE